MILKVGPPVLKLGSWDLLLSWGIPKKLQEISFSIPSISSGANSKP